MLLLNHVVKGKVDISNFSKQEFRSLGGHVVLLEHRGKKGTIKINEADVIRQAIETERFIIYVVDEMININSQDITKAVERVLQSSPRVNLQKRKDSVRPRGPPRPLNLQPTGGTPQPPAIPLFIRSPSPPLDGPQPPAWIPEEFSRHDNGVRRKRKNVIILGSLTKKRQVNQTELNAIDRDIEDTSKTSNIGSGGNEDPKQRLLLAELMSPLMTASAKEISKMMKDDMDFGQRVVPHSKSSSRQAKLIDRPVPTNRIGRNRNLATASIFSNLPIYQFLAGAVAARVDLRNGDLTLLAPSDLALHRLEISLPALIIRNRASAIKLIRNHVITGSVTMRDGVKAGALASIEGHELSFEGEDGTYSVNGVPVLTPDVVLSNGVIHVIDGVLIPDDESMDLELEHDIRNKDTDVVAAEIESILQDFFPHSNVGSSTEEITTNGQTMPTIEMNLDDENIEPLPPMLKSNSFPSVFSMLETDFKTIEEYIPGMTIPQPSGEPIFVGMRAQKKKPTKIIAPTTRAPFNFDYYDDGAEEISGEDFKPIGPPGSEIRFGKETEKLVEDPEARGNDLLEPLNQIDEFAESFQLSEETLAGVLRKNRCTKMLNLLEKANLLSKFESKGPYTVFAPSDEAFQKLPSERVEELNLRPMLLRRLLLFHIVTQENQEDIQVGNDVLFETMEGSPIRFNIYDGVVLVNGVRISKTDLDFKNGVVHILDQIIFPPLGNVAVTMKDRDFDAKKFLDAFDMQTINILEGATPITVIAPMDSAFDEANVAWDDLLKNPSEVNNIINGHIIPGVLFSEACRSQKSLFTINGRMVVCEYQNGTLKFNGVDVIDKDITATNGVIHLIPNLLQLPQAEFLLKNKKENLVLTSTLAIFEDAFFTPAPGLGFADSKKENSAQRKDLGFGDYDSQIFTTEPEAETLPPVTIMRPTQKNKPKKIPSTVYGAVGQQNLTIFAKFLSASGLKDLVDQEGPWTVFAPTNAAFSMLPAAIVQQLSHDRFYLKRILSYHIVPGRLTRRHLANDAVFPTLSDGTEVRTNQYSDGNVMWYTVSGSRILHLDEKANNGVVHVLENVLYPPHGDMLSTLNGSPILMQISMLIHDLAISNEVQGDPITLFVPSDEAFQQLNVKTMKNQRRLRAWLRKHIVKGTHFSIGLIEGKVLNSIDGFSKINITESPHCVNANGQELLYPDIAVTNGVLHVTNGLMFDM
ncbi:hypothetical protein QYM36_001374 [Artemia franciscana]|nr:hypothetical protein QYM36_001374 [Artemia franciscana]